MSKTTNNVFINHYPSQMVHINKSTDKDGNEREFASISFPCPESISGYASFSVNLQQLLPAKKKDGSTVPNRYNILLGDKDKTRKVSVAIAGNKKRTEYDNINLTNNQIAQYISEARNSYAGATAASA